MRKEGGDGIGERIHGGDTGVDGQILFHDFGVYYKNVSHIIIHSAISHKGVS